MTRHREIHVLDETRREEPPERRNTSTSTRNRLPSREVERAALIVPARAFT